jgi:hypothetical protein
MRNKRRTYQDLPVSGFNVKVHRIDRRNSKHADFSSTTIDGLIRKGREEARSQTP